jgi:hypothetical protein
MGGLGTTNAGDAPRGRLRQLGAGRAQLRVLAHRSQQASRIGDTLPDRTQGRWRYGCLFASVWLLYLIEPLRVALARPDPVRATSGAACVLGFAALYVITWSRLPSLRRVGGRIPAARAGPV